MKAARRLALTRCASRSYRLPYQVRTRAGCQMKNALSQGFVCSMQSLTPVRTNALSRREPASPPAHTTLGGKQSP
jgi:hypothetical protein